MIDLVSSDDEIVVSSDDEIVVFDSSTSRAQSKRERKSEVLPGKRYKKNWEEGEGTMGQNLSVDNTSSHGALQTDVETTPRLKFDDDGDENAIITYGLLELLCDMNLNGVISCGVGGSRDVSTLQHIQQNDEWSCGFRNLQMMLSALIPHLKPNHSFFQVVPRRLQNTTIPSLRQIQSALEQSWKAGFDPNGAEHYRYKVLGRNSKIGAVEVSSVMSYWGLDSTVVQFIKCRKSRELLPKFLKAYFSKCLGKEGCPFCSSGSSMSSNACAEELLQFASIPHNLRVEKTCNCPLLPLYLQWEGHSVSIIGVEGDSSLLVFDTLKNGNLIRKDLESKRITPLRLSFAPLLKKDVQIIICSMRSLTKSEKESRRIRPSTATAAKEAVLLAVNSAVPVRR